jgi:hypothetical protein
MTYFDSRRCKLDVKHIMASGALPPAFPTVRVNGELYWDGGILSNTPTEVVLDDNPRRDSLIFTVHLWNPVGAEPTTMAEVLNRHKDVQYSSRIASQITRHQQAHRLPHVINELAARLPESERDRPEAKELMSYGCQTRMHVVQLLAPQLSHEDHTKDVDFSPTGIRQRWTRVTPTPRPCSRASPGSGSSSTKPRSMGRSQPNEFDEGASAAAPLSRPGGGQLIQLSRRVQVLDSPFAADALDHPPQQGPEIAVDVRFVQRLQRIRRRVDFDPIGKGLSAPSNEDERIDHS